MTEAPAAPKGGAWVSETRVHRSRLTPTTWDGRAMWRQLRGYCADVGNDGVLPMRLLHVAVERTIPLRKAQQIVAELVEDGLVTVNEETGCYLLDWSDQPSAEEWNDPVLRWRRARNKRLLRDSELCQRVKDRDRNLCRYCGTRVNWNIKTPNHPLGGTYDHVDPDVDNLYENVVVSCRRCNGRKRDRTPEQAGMTLHRSGTTAEQVEAVSRGPTRGQPGADPPANVPLRARARPDRANPGPTPGQPSASHHPAGLERASAVPPPDDSAFPGEEEGAA